MRSDAPPLAEPFSGKPGDQLPLVLVVQDVVMTARPMASITKQQTKPARVVCISVLQLTGLRFSKFAAPGWGIGRAAAAQIAKTKTAASSIQIIEMSQIPITHFRSSVVLPLSAAKAWSLDLWGWLQFHGQLRGCPHPPSCALATMRWKWCLARSPQICNRSLLLPNKTPTHLDRMALRATPGFDTANLSRRAIWH